jgi:hypothetical protein
MRHLKRASVLVAVTLVLTGCDYVRLLRPSVLKQLNPHVVRLVNELPAVDDPNEAIVARLFAHGGLSELYGAPRGNTLVVFALP